jgi:pterin-4a-carbinolamine dehydratase
MAMTEIFVSYRRESSQVVDHLHDKLSRVTADGAVFLDRSDIEPGEEFPDRLRRALSEAHLVLAFIGRDWISIQHPVTYQRKLDMETDWVRVELEQAIRERKKIIPVLIEGARPLSAEQLPESLRGLATLNAVSLSIERFLEDVDRLVTEIERQLGAETVARLAGGTDGKFPPRPGFVPSPLSEEQIATLLAELPQWRLIESDLLDDDRFGPGYKRIELVREFRFRGFTEAVLFMAKASESVDVLGHHPRWENVFRTVTVHFSTWDIGHRPSDRDHRAAKNMEREYEQFLHTLSTGGRYELCSSRQDPMLRRTPSKAP